jgi:hypothetical protein
MVCAHCGELVGDEALACRCGAAPTVTADSAFGRRRIVPFEEGIVTFLRQMLAGVESTWIHPSIPPKKLLGVLEVHGHHLVPGECVLGVYDGTVFGSATDGFAITARCLYFKNQLDGPRLLRWSDIDEHEIYADGSALVIGRARIDTLYGRDDDALWVWADAIQTLARSAQAPAVPATRAASTAPSPWERVPSSWPPAPASYAHRNDVERLPRAPYATPLGCSVVDVHPSGEIAVACGGDAVELRYTRDGTPYRAFRAADVVLAARFSPDGDLLAIGGRDGEATLHDARTCQIRGKTKPMADACNEIVWLGVTGRFAMASQRGELWIVDGASAQVVHPILGPDPDYEQLGGIAAAADGSTVYVSLGDRIGAFDGATGGIRWRFDGALMNPARLSVSPRGDVLVAAGDDGIVLFDARTGQPGARCPLPSARRVSWPEGDLHDRMRGEGPMELSWTPRPRFSPLGNLVALQDHVGNLLFLDAQTFAVHPTPREIGRAWIEDVAWFSDGNHVLLGSSDNTLSIWRVNPLVGLMRVEAVAGA